MIPILYALLALLPAVLLLGAIEFRSRFQRASALKLPVTDKLLRSPGESAFKKIKEFDLKTLEIVTAFVGVPAIVLVFYLSFKLSALHPLPEFGGMLVVVGAVVFVGTTMHLIGILRQRNNWRLGYRGERFVGEELNKLMSEGCHVFHDFPLGACLKTTEGAVCGEKDGWQGTMNVNASCGSSTEEQENQSADSAKTFRAAGLLPVAGVGSAFTARCGDAQASPPWPQPKSLAAASPVVFKKAPGENWKLDYVVVAPSGVYAIETKTRNKVKARRGQRQMSHEIIYDGKGLQFPDYYDTEQLTQAQNQADRLAQFLGRALQGPVYVNPILTFPGWYVIARALGEVTVLNPKQIHLKVVKSTPVLSPDQVKRIARQLEEKCRDVEF